MIYAYIRKSTSTQEFEHMEYEIKQYALASKIKINKWVEESISSRKPLSKRALGSLLETLQANDILITTEISRLGRSLLEVMSILQTCLNKGCQVITIKEHYHLGNDLQSQVLAFAFGLSAQIESQSASALRSRYKWLSRVYFKENIVWSTGYFVSSVGANEEIIKNYVKHQGQRDLGQLRPEL